MKTLNEKQWSEFIISDLFEIKSVRGLPAENYKKGTEPYITTSAENNGLTDFVATDGTPVSAKNAISIDPIKGKAFFHSYDFIGRGFSGASINLLYNKNLNRHTGLFVCLTIEMISRNKASYGNLFNSYRLRNGKIRLPIDDNGNPDWEFMSDYMKMHEKKLINRYEKYLNRLKTTTKQVISEPKQWLEFKIGDLFGLVQGKSKGLNHLQEASKGVNYLGATNQNNGVLTSVLPIDKQIQKGNAIAFIRNGEGSMGYAVYKAEDFIATSDITVGYNENLNRYVGQYIVSVANKVRGKYNFGYKRSGARLAKETLLLPATENGEPDWVYMEAYERERERELMLHIKNWLKKLRGENTTSKTFSIFRQANA